jgi:catalase
VQIVEEEDEFNFDFDLLDPTKMIPEEIVPVQRIGKMTLNRNPDNFFAETEQVAFHPGHVVPGIDFTNDPLLQARLFSYLDTQLIRLGGPNFNEIPINRPLAAVHNNQRDGFMRQTINKGRVNYSPNSLGDGCPMMTPEAMGGYAHHAERVDGHKIRARSESFMDHFSQARMFWKSLTPVEQDHLVDAAHFELGKVETMAVRERVVALFHHIDADLATRTAAGIGVAMPTGMPDPEVTLTIANVAGPHGAEVRQGVSKPARDVEPSPAVSITHLNGDTIQSRRVAILAADGVNHAEVMAVKDALERGGALIEVVSKTLGELRSDNGDSLAADKTFVTTASVMYDAVLVPGGMDSVETLKNHGDALHFVNEAFKHCKAIGAMGEGVELLAAADIEGVAFAGPRSEEELVVDRGVVTSRDGMDNSAFGDAFAQAIAEHRHWDRAMKDRVPA